MTSSAPDNLLTASVRYGSFWNYIRTCLSKQYTAFMKAYYRWYFKKVNRLSEIKACRDHDMIRFRKVITTWDVVRKVTNFSWNPPACVLVFMGLVQSRALNMSFKKTNWYYHHECAMLVNLAILCRKKVECLFREFPLLALYLWAFSDTPQVSRVDVMAVLNMCRVVIGDHTH